jgi:hypothetical protein
LLNSQAFKVTRSAWNVLKVLRYEDRLRIIWIDAICINQACLEEKVAQLKLMGDIYRKATSVRVWLGTDDDGDINSISILKDMNSVQGVRHTLGASDSSQKRTKHVQQFFTRPWW